MSGIIAYPPRQAPGGSPTPRSGTEQSFWRPNVTSPQDRSTNWGAPVASVSDTNKRRTEFGVAIAGGCGC